MIVMITRVNNHASDKDKCDELSSKLCIASGVCLRCGNRSLLTPSHIVPRRFSATRTDLSNLQCICMPCARYLTDNPHKFKQFLVDTIGETEYDWLWHKARTVTKVRWDEEFIRLKNLVDSTT